MKQITLLFVFIIACMAAVAQQRYIDEVFTDVQVTPDITYGENFTIFPTGAPVLQDLKLEVYEPAGDTASARPLIIYMHPGDFLPLLINGSPTGDLHDSAVVEMCMQFARRGYVVANMDYRLGWNPLATSQDCRTATLIMAVYRGLQDAKTCTRYFRMNAAVQGNTYNIDTNKIVVGGQGSAGYIATAYAYLDDPAELNLLKFISGSTDLSCGVVAGQSYVDQSLWGDFDGFGGLPILNNPNWPGYSSNVNMVFNLEGGLGDSSWMEAGDVPIVAFHDVNNPLAPYTNGPVIVSLTGQFVIWVTGSHDFVRISNQLGNQTFSACTYTDPYTTRANQVNEGWEGLFPLVQPDPNIYIPGDPYHGQTSPWEWWSCTDLETVAPLYGLTVGYADTICMFVGPLTNPLMSKTRGLAYIDSVQGYLCPRISCALFTVGIDEAKLFDEQVNLFPNPTAQVAHLKLADPASHFLSIKIYDLEGRKVFQQAELMQNEIEISCIQFGKGVYMLQVQTEKGIAIGKLVIE